VEALLPEAEYVFRHPLTRDVAYGSQLAERRSARHARAARAIIAAEPGRADERAALIAHHWEHAGEPALAARAYRRAAERAGLGHATKSFAHWAKVRELAKLAPATPATDEDGAAACAQLLLVGARTGLPFADIDLLFADGTELAQRSGNVDARARLLAAYGGHSMLARCDFETARPSVEEARRLAEQGGDLPTRIMAGLLSGQVLAWGGAFSDALDSVERTLPLCGSDWDLGSELIGYSPRFAIGFYQVVSLVYLGRTAAARAGVDALLAWALATDDRFLHCSGLSLLALATCLEGNESAAVGHARRALALAEESDLAGLRLLAHREVGRALVQSEQWTEALAVLEHAVVLLRTFDTYRVVEPQIRGHLAETYAAVGDAEMARAESVRALSAAARGGGHLQTETLLSRIRVLLALDGAAAVAEASGLADRARLLTEQCGAARQLPLVDVEQARIARAAGDAAAAERSLAAARERFTAIGLAPLAARL